MRGHTRSTAHALVTPRRACRPPGPPAVIVSDMVAEIVRGARAHLSRYNPHLGDGGLERAQLGLAHR